jgi:hypothetical protein
MGFNKSSQSSNQSAASEQFSDNQAYPLIRDSLEGQIGSAPEGNNAIRSLLGLAGDTGQREAFDNFRNSSAYQFQQEEGTRGVTNSQAAKGMLGSGATLKGIARFSNNLATQYLDKYLDRLAGVSDAGIKAAQVIGGAGQRSRGTSTSQGTSKGSSFGVSLG